MRHILVTGGAGFIGSHTVVALVEAGYNPVVVDNFSNSGPSVMINVEKIVDRKIKFYKGNFQDVALLKKIFNEQTIGGIIHFAAYKSVAESIESPLKYYQNNVSGFIDLLAAAETNQLTNIVFSSSATVYGEADAIPTPETAPFKQAACPYGTTKQMCETILRDLTVASSCFKSIALRYFNPIGAHASGLIGELPHGVPSNLIPFVTQTAAGLQDSLTVFGDNYETSDGSCVRDYIHVIDLARAHIAALKHLEKRSPGYYEVFNVGTGQGNSVLEVLRTFTQVTGQKVNYRMGQRRPGDIAVSCAAVDKIQRDLGWRAELDLATSLKDAWRWQQILNDTSSQ